MAVHNDGPECLGCEKKLKFVHPYMADWFRRKKKDRHGLHIAWGYRNEDEQNQFFKEGKSEKPYPASLHNHMTPEGKPCSLALDIFIIDEDGIAKWPPLLYAKINAENQADREPIRWGGTFKLKGGGSDANHFEYRGP